MTPIEQIKSKLSIVDVVSSYIKLQKAGGSYKALCPFHNEKSPSFNVSPARDAYYCFGCNMGGDIFTFVQEMEGVQFIDALKILAERAGVELKATDREGESIRERLLQIMEAATQFYEKELAGNKDAEAYLKSRGLTDQTIAKFRIGFAPSPAGGDWRVLYDHLRTQKFKDEEIERAGLIKQPDQQGGGGNKRPYDRFRSRIMFPLFDANGRVVAFSGRSFGEEGENIAKYINSPETPLYDKSSYLFGYNLAKAAIRKQNFSILVEGQVDLIMAHQAGTENTVAVSGTALTGNHLGLLRRLSDNIVFAFDADEAGLNATSRAFTLALAAGMSVRVARIGDGKDPADYIRANGRQAWAKVVASSRHIVDFYLETLAERQTAQAGGYDARKFRAEVESNVLPLILAMQSKIEQAHFIVEVARRLGIPEKSVWDEVTRVRGGAKTIAPDLQAVTKASVKSRRQLAEEEIVGILLWQESAKAPVFDTKELREAYDERLKAHELTPYTPSPEEREVLVLRAEYTYQPEKLERTVSELLDSLEMEVLREKQADLWRRLSESEMKGEKDKAKECLAAYQLITPRLIALEDRRVKRNIIV